MALWPWAGRADRRLCPGLVGVILGLPPREVAAAMRAAGVTHAITVFQTNSWLTGTENVPGWLTPLIDRADLRSPARASQVDERMNQLRHLQGEVWNALGTGRRIRGQEREAVAAQIALESLYALAIAAGDTAGLGPNEIAALERAGVDPENESTWFIPDPDDGALWYPRPTDDL